jgi:hypothetical protein
MPAIAWSASWIALGSRSVTPRPNVPATQDIHQPDGCGTRQSTGPAGDSDRTLCPLHERREDVSNQCGGDQGEHDRSQLVDHPERQRQRSKRQDDLQGDLQVGW